jgi:hypothetical protein
MLITDSKIINPFHDDKRSAQHDVQDQPKGEAEGKQLADARDD